MAAPPEPEKKRKTVSKKKKKSTRASRPNYESSDRSENRDLIDLYTPFENLMSNYRVS